MLPRATGKRTPRDVSRLKIAPRSSEIQRLIGRSLRSVVDMEALGEHTITIDCDVLQADGGTRVASVSGGFVALYSAINKLLQEGRIKENPIREFVAAVSCDICNGEAVLDVDYEEDSSSQVDMNFVLTESGKIVEIQGTAEGEPFEEKQFFELLELGKQGIKQIISKQRSVLNV
jgi:ribonuclease PH